mgnify:CR=1 FL=1
MTTHRSCNFRLERTLARCHALEPLVLNVFVADTSAVLEPSASRSAAADSAGFAELGTLGTRHHGPGDG